MGRSEKTIHFNKTRVNLIIGSGLRCLKNAQLFATKVFQRTNMSYREIQQQLKQFRLAGLTEVKLNAKKKVLEKELNRCFDLGLSETQLQKRIAYQNKIKQIAQPDSLANLKTKVYSITGLDSLAKIRKSYPQIRESNFDFRSKQAWKYSLKILEEVHQETLKFEQFTTEVKAKIEQYKLLMQEMGDASSQYIAEKTKREERGKMNRFLNGKIQGQRQTIKAILRKAEKMTKEDILNKLAEMEQRLAISLKDK